MHVRAAEAEGRKKRRLSLKRGAARLNAKEEELFLKRQKAAKSEHELRAEKKTSSGKKNFGRRSPH